MKSLSTLVFLLGMIVTGMAAPGIPAKEAFRLLTKATGPAVSSKVVYVSGPLGQDQPQVWLFTIRNSQGFFVEYNMTGKKLIGSRNVPAFAVGKPITSARWKIDSASAFLTAEKIARQTKLGFDSMNYELRCAEFSDLPVWFLTLLDSRRAKIAEITISAETGAVLRKNFFAPAPAIAGPQGAPPPAPGQTMDLNQNPQSPTTMWDKTKSTLNRSGEAVKNGATRTGTAIKGWLNRITGREPAPQQYYYGQPVR